MKRRRKISRRKSQRNFKKHAKVNRRNAPSTFTRGGRRI